MSKGLAGMAPDTNTSRPRPQHKVYQYRLRSVTIDRPNRALSTDITYIRLAHGTAPAAVILARRQRTW